ncbi:PMCA-type calcium-translocating P-type ATPase [Dimargaris cristalligena]|uniref:Calcium-transporting ATPase n=1 Tax=Dimargaris cristalligena TaxID=215637 RepID=A0A4P9ZVJ1_9FUNG|nr:PMCA-type calcium-translocating P-type ATPase [Dimargaris cristalligena]|eukprot:RKP37646.1 PMCA-type calcium-translocating P-type ATPase [Dimargaris cristalligena]
MLDPKDPELLQKLGGIAGLCEKLRVDPSQGLCPDEMFESDSTPGPGHQESSALLASSHLADKGKGPFAARQAVYGENRLPAVDQVSFWSLVWCAYQDKTLIMLSIAALVSLAVGLYDDYLGEHRHNDVKLGWVEGVAIFLAVVVVVFTNALNDYQKERQFQKLNAKKEDRCVKVYREGREIELSVFDVLVGDILLVEPGEIIPVDGVYLDGHNLVCDESSATGESDAIKKGTVDSGMDCFVLSGAKVMEGVGRVVVIAVGPRSFYGKMMMALRDEGDSVTPLQRKLDVLAEQIAKFGLTAALLMFMTLILKYLITAAIDNDMPTISALLSRIIQITIQAITIVVVAVPEGLPMAVTLALAFATTQMLKDNNLVRQLSACETMGNATAVCSDKTGTLTQNKMTVTRAYFAQHTMSSHEQHCVQAFRDELPGPVFDRICEGIAVNSNAFLGKDERGQPTFIGSKTESALLGFTQKCGSDFEPIRRESEILRVYPFASEKKTMTTVIKNAHSHGNDDACRIYTKGASEIVLGCCDRYVDRAGEVQPLDARAKADFERIIQEYAANALRTISMAYREVSAADAASLPEDDAPTHNLICLGIVGIEDPLRPGVRESVETCRAAGVVVRMITGDNVETARAIAKNAGIYQRGGAVVSGPQFRAMPPEQQRRIMPKLQVLARSSPTDKQIVMRILQEAGEVVAMTGDGTNDAPALKMADVGFSMGITGTEVAKEASAIILMDDNFNSIVKALQWGRAVNDSVRKFLQFQLTVNITAVVLAFVSAVASEDSSSILTAVQLLWVNLIMDTLAALALATEPPTEELLKRLPAPRNASLINYQMWRMIFGQAIFQVLINLLLIHLGPAVFHLPNSPQGDQILRTMVFNSFVFLQVFNELNCRRIDDTLNVFENLHRDYGFLLVQVAVVGAQALIVTFGGMAFGTVPLTAGQWAATVFIGSLSLPVGLMLRLSPDFSSCLGLESAHDQEHRPQVTRGGLRWETAIGDIQSIQRAQRRMSIFTKVRRAPLRSNSKLGSMAPRDSSA